MLLHIAEFNMLQASYFCCDILFTIGNYPLHLAAWNGHADVARVLINTGPSRANVNEQASYI